MNSRERRNLTMLSRFWLLAAVSVLSGCASLLGPVDEAAPSVPVPQSETSSIEVADIDDALAKFFGPQGHELILLPNRLDRTQLDYSMDSLHVIDRWLLDIHTINQLQGDKGRAGEILVFDGRGDNSVTFAGLYLGQVIRANAEVDWHWQRFDVFLAANPVFAEHYGQESGLDSFVLVGPQGATTPINTALKRVLYGKEESLHFIAQLLSKEVDLDKAMSGQDLLGMDRRDWPG